LDIRFIGRVEFGSQVGTNDGLVRPETCMCECALGEDFDPKVASGILPKTLTVADLAAAVTFTQGAQPDMREIPLHLQRRFEQRWAARFPILRAAPTPPKSIVLKEIRLPNVAVAVEHIVNDESAA
jgi:hypothetical protein